MSEGRSFCAVTQAWLCSLRTQLAASVKWIEVALGGFPISFSPGDHVSFTVARGSCGSRLCSSAGRGNCSSFCTQRGRAGRGPLLCKVQTVPWSQEAPASLTRREQPLPAPLPRVGGLSHQCLHVVSPSNMPGS